MRAPLEGGDSGEHDPAFSPTSARNVVRVLHPHQSRSLRRSSNQFRNGHLYDLV